MNKKLIIFVCVLILVLIAVAVWFVVGQRPSTPPHTSGAQFPSSGSVGSGGSAQYITVGTTTTGEAVTTRDFMSLPTTKADPINAGLYYLNSTTSPDNSFVIQYDHTAQYFTIELLQEPLGAARIRAEQTLMNALGLQQSEMCGLKYYLGVTNDVNSLYAGENLGFSFCPGAVKLP